MEETNFTRRYVSTSVGAVTVSEESSSDKLEEAVEMYGPREIKHGPSPEASQANLPIVHNYTPKTYLAKLKLWQKQDKPNELLGMITRPFVYLSFPVVVFCGFYYGASLVWFNVLNATAALILTGTYGFSTSMVGVSYASPLLGVLLGAAYTGIWGNSFTMRLARRKGGVLESEHRLWLLTPAIILLPFGLILWGVGASHGIHWFGAVFAMFVVGGSSAISVQGTCNYCIESYRALSGEAIITVILIRNTMSFAIGYGVTPWVENMGLQNAFIVAAVAAALQCATVLIMIYYGKSLRRKSAARYAGYVESMAASGMAH